ncbi:antibiotic biosynthesis monooxygenase family protein [Mucilaginibacter sp. CSA2-8R]|uniref:putative quinol monooxygenase n=1 Tax=Mucilaginibacter sp. CSA2-8R TaxID=3141542 RepID=UPI00315CCB66
MRNAWTVIAILLLVSTFDAKAQPTKMKVRIAKIEIHAEYLTQYRQALAEHAKAAVSAEPGVLTLNAVYDQNHPAQVTVFEAYASEEAYQSHLKTAHFLKYKNGTLKMVKSLELIDVAPIALESKLTTHL